jgi:hypothetical protein
MRCAKYERWISDRLDGALSVEKGKKLETHLAACLSCRAFSRTAQRVQQEAKAIPAAPVPEGYWEESLNRLRKRLDAPSPRAEKKPFLGLGWKWVFVAAPLVLLVVAGGILFFSRPAATAADYYLNDHERLGLIYSEIGDNPELERAFNRVLESSIQDHLSGEGEVLENHLENPLLYRVVSDEDMAFVVEELKKEMKS